MFQTVSVCARLNNSYLYICSNLLKENASRIKFLQSFMDMFIKKVGLLLDIGKFIKMTKTLIF